MLRIEPSIDNLPCLGNNFLFEAFLKRCGLSIKTDRDLERRSSLSTE
jgi:hypothetical protein